MPLLVWLILGQHRGLRLGKDHPLLELPRWARAPVLPPRRALPWGFSPGNRGSVFWRELRARGAGSVLWDRDRKGFVTAGHLPWFLSARCPASFLPTGKNQFPKELNLCCFLKIPRKRSVNHAGKKIA